MNAPRHVNAPGLAKPAGHYSHATVANGFVFVAGQLPVRPDGSRMGDASSFEEQARQVLANVRAVLQAAGSDVEKLVQVRVYVDDIANWPGFNAIYAEWAGAARPARCVVPTGELHHGVKLEVEAMALA
ncbi:RidA family protein [Ramlibacter sp. G-1-2-2]|uniref:RidA family protein n=1 Tax=Ramlibacter agri TaxID=2728837 RepID=A0A848H227_9BURK|nr:RidA family protein [Ramlibacter agri]NML43631.1 RidA family protein [Ramlibacter agri]